MADQPQSIDSSNPPVRAVVPGLEVMEVISQGSHGTVYRARQRGLDRMIALKVLDASLADTPSRFERERVALGRISDHPAIVSLLDSGWARDGSPYLVLEHAPSGTLSSHLDGRGPLSLDDATGLAVCLAAAVEHMHRAGVVHCDIKPDNILRSTYGEWLLADFGIAAMAEEAGTNVIHATFAHAAPEIFTGSPPVASLDVYSLASVLATCLSGIEPFAGFTDEAPASVMRRVMTDPYPDLRHHDVPDDLASLLEAALSKESSHRPISAQAFAVAINNVRLAHGLQGIPLRLGSTDIAGPTNGLDNGELGNSAASIGQRTIDLDSAPTDAAYEDADSSETEHSSRIAMLLLSVGLFVGAGAATWITTNDALAGLQLPQLESGDASIASDANAPGEPPGIPAPPVANEDDLITDADDGPDNNGGADNNDDDDDDDDGDGPGDQNGRGSRRGGPGGQRGGNGNGNGQN